MIHSQKHLDPSHMLTMVKKERRNTEAESAKKGKLKHLKRQLSNVRKKLEELSIDFEETQGYKPSQVSQIFYFL